MLQENAGNQMAYDLSPEELARAVVRLGEPAYRGRQIFGWLYRHFAQGWEEMQNIPRGLQEKLAAEYDLPGLSVVAEALSAEAQKLLVEYGDGARVECVSLCEGATPTFCLSTQVGCSMGCAFCASTVEGCERNLTAGEIVAQAMCLGARHGRPGNLVFMGMGEPLLNLAQVAVAVARLTDRRGLGISARRVTVATAGVVPRIRKLAELDLGVNLAVSLNATREEQRRELMPGVARWSLRELLEACAEFSDMTGGQPVTFAYVLMEGVNDFPADAERLLMMLKPLRHHLNLIPLNPVEHALLRRPSEGHLRRFQRRLQAGGINVSVRWSKGEEIRAACGQLRQQKGGASPGGSWLPSKDSNLE